MVETNNQLAPTAIEVTEKPPPPPPVVTVHASQHEEGGDDEVSIDGLHGRAAEQQTPAEHANTHATGADDEINVDGLHGKLADGQTVEKHGNAQHTPAMATVTNLADHVAATNTHALAANLEHVTAKGNPGGYAPLDNFGKVPLSNLPPIGGGPHVETHELGGSDALDVAGLSGVLAQAQVPKTHDNTAHSKTYEDQANKGTPGGYCDLTELTAIVPEARLVTEAGAAGPNQFLTRTRKWEVPAVGVPDAHKTSHQDGGTDELSIAGLSGRAADAQPPLAHKANHEVGGVDALSVNGLRGTLADQQDPIGHRGRHENGGADEMSVSGLSGVLADPQPIAAHQLTHRVGGGDTIDVMGLHGTLADPQIPGLHANNHKHGFSDPIDVSGLSGVLADQQPSLYACQTSGPVTIPGGANNVSLTALTIPSPLVHGRLGIRGKAYGLVSMSGSPGQQQFLEWKILVNGLLACNCSVLWKDICTNYPVTAIVEISAYQVNPTTIALVGTIFHIGRVKATPLDELVPSAVFTTPVLCPIGSPLSIELLGGFLWGCETSLLNIHGASLLTETGLTY